TISHVQMLPFLSMLLFICPEYLPKIKRILEPIFNLKLQQKKVLVKIKKPVLTDSTNSVEP
ncbi:MAG: hypothetical protein RLY43_55, partial [Bacteroidota bacterium]